MTRMRAGGQAWFWIGALALLAGGAARGAENEGTIVHTSGAARLLPLALSGYTGETASVLRFDLEIAGFELVDESKAQWLLKGANAAQVEGRLSDAFNKAVKFNKSYTGASLRVQAHALADDVVEAVTGKPGIARTKIAFKVAQNRASEVYYADYDGGSAVALTQDGAIVAAPAWVPHQRKLYYVTYKFGNADIVSHDLGSGARQLVARYSGSNISPAASPDGRHVAMVLSKGGSPDIYVADADGGNLRQVTRTREDESSPCWSPDGLTLCFATRVEGRRVLAKAPAQGGPLRVLPTTGVSAPSEPDWSPDGTTIVFTAQMGDFEICTVPAKGGDAQVLVAGEDPSWAPNSRTVVFTRRQGASRRGLSLLDVHTKRVKDVATNLGGCSQPAWAR